MARSPLAVPTFSLARLSFVASSCIPVLRYLVEVEGKVISIIERLMARVRKEAIIPEGAPPPCHTGPYHRDIIRTLSW